MTSDRIEPPFISAEDEPCMCGTPFTCLARHAVEPPSDDLLYDAWCVIANAVGWDDDTEWRRAAIRWRDRWHETLDG